jgi:hypothetical protein
MKKLFLGLGMLIASLQLSYAGASPPPVGPNSNIQQINGTTINLGQAVMANSLPVAIAADQTPIPVTGTFFPVTQAVSGSVAVSSLPSLTAGSAAIGSVSVSNFPVSQAVTGAFYPAIQPVSGYVSVSNFPATQPVSGTVSVTSLPALSAGSAAIGSVSISNFPPLQPVSGTISVSNFPGTQPVSGTLAVSTLPALATGANTIGAVNQGTAGSSSWLVSDNNSAPFASVVAITPGTAFTAGRSIGYICTTAGNITLTFANSSTITFPIVASASLQTLPFSPVNLALGTGTVASFWNLP